jgi:hypothetical protein
MAFSSQGPNKERNRAGVVSPASDLARPRPDGKMRASIRFQDFSA